MIDEKELMLHIEKEYEEWREEYDAVQILGDIEDFPKVNEWIPVKDRLPKRWERVLVTYISVLNEFLCDDCAMINEEGNWIWCFDESLVELQIIAWMPLPKPYKKENNYD